MIIENFPLAMHVIENQFTDANTHVNRTYCIYRTRIVLQHSKEKTENKKKKMKEDGNGVNGRECKFTYKKM